MITIQSLTPDDIFIRDSESGNTGNLLDLIHAEMAFTETVMCRANAINLYDMKCALELAASEIQEWYDKWKNKDFQR